MSKFMREELAANKLGHQFFYSFPPTCKNYFLTLTVSLKVEVGVFPFIVLLINQLTFHFFYWFNIRYYFEQKIHLGECIVWNSGTPTGY